MKSLFQHPPPGSGDAVGTYHYKFLRVTEWDQYLRRMTIPPPFGTTINVPSLF